MALVIYTEDRKDGREKEFPMDFFFFFFGGGVMEEAKIDGNIRRGGGCEWT